MSLSQLLTGCTDANNEARTGAQGEPGRRNRALWAVQPPLHPPTAPPQRAHRPTSAAGG